MRLVKEITQKYKELKKLTFPTMKERAYMRDYERAFAKMSNFDRDFFLKTYIKTDNTEWWREKYSKEFHLRMRSSVSKKFLKYFTKYEA